VLDATYAILSRTLSLFTTRVKSGGSIGYDEAFTGGNWSERDETAVG